MHENKKPRKMRLRAHAGLYLLLRFLAKRWDLSFQLFRLFFAPSRTA